MPEPGGQSFELPDVNVLVALTSPSHQHHGLAHDWLAGVRVFATTPITESGLVRLMLNPTVTGQDVSGRQALQILQGIRGHRRAIFLSDESSLGASVIDVVGLTGHRQVTDLHLANLAASHGGVLTTFDRRLPHLLAARDQAAVRVL